MRGTYAAVITRPEKLSAFRLQKKLYKFTLYIIQIKTYNLKISNWGGGERKKERMGGREKRPKVTKLLHHLSMDEYTPILK
jgi:hypothetical protein